MHSQEGQPWHTSLSVSDNTLTSASTPNITVTDDKSMTIYASNDNISDGNISDGSSNKDPVADETDHNETHNTKLSSSCQTESFAKVKTEYKNDSSFTSQRETNSALKQRFDTEKCQLEQENKAFKEQLLALQDEVQQCKNTASSREAELQMKINQMKAEHDIVCAEMGAKDAELNLELESLQEKYANEFHGTVHVKQLQMIIKALQQKVRRLEKEKKKAFGHGRQDLYKINEQLTEELSQARAEISYLKHMTPKKYLRSHETTQNLDNPTNEQ